MTLDDIRYALAKQLDGDSITLNTDCGELVIDGDEGRKTAAAIRRILIMAETKRLKNGDNHEH